MRIYLSANPNPKYIFEDMDEQTVRLLKKALYTNFYHNNFSTNQEEELCERMINSLEALIPIQETAIPLAA